MTPGEIKEKFGAEALDKLYDVIFDRPAYEMADWILLYHDEAAIKKWLDQLAKDEAEYEGDDDE